MSLPCFFFCSRFDRTRFAQECHARWIAKCDSVGELIAAFKQSLGNVSSTFSYRIDQTAAAHRKYTATMVAIAGSLRQEGTGRPFVVCSPHLALLVSDCGYANAVERLRTELETEINALRAG